MGFFQTLAQISHLKAETNARVVAFRERGHFESSLSILPGTRGYYVVDAPSVLEPDIEKVRAATRELKTIRDSLSHLNPVRAYVSLLLRRTSYNGNGK